MPSFFETRQYILIIGFVIICFSLGAVKHVFACPTWSTTPYTVNTWYIYEVGGTSYRPELDYSGLYAARITDPDRLAWEASVEAVYGELAPKYSTMAYHAASDSYYIQVKLTRNITIDGLGYIYTWYYYLSNCGVVFCTDDICNSTDANAECKRENNAGPPEKDPNCYKK